MKAVPLELKQANTFVDMLHRHHDPVFRDKFRVGAILDRFSFWYFHLAIKPGYYEGFSLDIESNFPVAFDNWEERKAAQREITQIKKCLIELAGVGLVACFPGWCTGYLDYKGTLQRINEAIKEMREEVKATPTWRQYEREAV